MRWRFIAVGLVAYVLGLLIMAPASLLDTVLRQASDGRLRLAEAQGSLWSGEGQIEIREPSKRAGSLTGKTGIAKSFSWRFLPESLLRGHLDCEVRLDQARKPILVTMGLTKTEVTDAAIDLPATALGLAVPKLAALGLSGDMALHIAHLSIGTIDNKGIKGNATLQWLAAGSALTSVSPLGDYELRLEDEGATLRASLRTLQGPLQLDGRGSWANGDRPVFLASARILPEHVQQLAPLLRLIAIERGEGNFELQLK